MENLELGERVIAFAEAHPELFDMSTFGITHACGTKACLSGHAQLLSGYKLPDGSIYFERPDGSLVADDEKEGIELLGLTDEEYYTREAPLGLFFMGSDRAALARFREIVTAERQRRAAEAGNA